MNQGLGVLDIRALAIAPGNPEVLYAGAESGGVYKSTDGGAIWQRSNNGMDPQAAVQDIVVDPTNPQVLYAADLRTGVYRSDDGGRLWVRINESLRTRAVKALAISADGGILYAATEGEGVFRLDLRPLSR
ncbi:WD40/YVTN/BNR-like repeat-containing protein [Chloroflexota bacterium]